MWVPPQGPFFFENLPLLLLPNILSVAEAFVVLLLVVNHFLLYRLPHVTLDKDKM